MQALPFRRRRTLRCSFCGKSEKEVTHLLSGAAGGRICSACIGVCNKILETVPAGFKGWDTVSADQLLQSLKPAEAAIDGMRSVLQSQVDELRKRGLSWEVIGAALGITRQAAWERFS